MPVEPKSQRRKMILIDPRKIDLDDDAELDKLADAIIAELGDGESEVNRVDGKETTVEW